MSKSKLDVETIMSGIARNAVVTKTEPLPEGGTKTTKEVHLSKSGEEKGAALGRRVAGSIGEPIGRLLGAVFGPDDDDDD